MNIQQVFTFVKAHGHIAFLLHDSGGPYIELWIPWNDEQGRQGQDYHRVENMEQAKDALGY